MGPLTPAVPVLSMRLEPGALVLAAETVAGTVEVARYVYRPLVPVEESPRPYVHPLRTLRGVVVTGFRPVDHTWHHGLSVAVPQVGEANLWGGPTYVRGRGYVPLPVHGRIQHEGFVGPATPDSVVQVLSWRGPGGTVLAHETRTLSALVLSCTAWALDWRSAITPSVTALVIGSPATRGRSGGAGYGGLFWRGAESFLDGLVTTGAGDQPSSGEARLGERAPWLAMTSPDRRASVEMACSAAASATAEATWFARSSEYPGAGPALAFSRELRVEPDETLVIDVRTTVRDGPHPSILP